MHAYGDIDEKKKVMRVNPKKGDAINTIIHEKMHQAHPDWTEKKVRKEALKKEGSMSLDAQAKVIKDYIRKTKGNVGKNR